MPVYICISSNFGCLPSLCMDCICGDAWVECSSGNAKPGDSFAAGALQSFPSRMVKRVGAYRWS